ncbi:MAG: DNA double-strand break repair nuclease NurA [Methanobacterium sp.]|uniref:DNA double-strand break repair nuclease NurA n=1 Tax=Methanobacterium sp. TaxID=2164 RepID=UPI003D64D39C|nr:DNA double-strand break repair nuclease NurA [Methanobacterium sp.]
MKSIKEIAEILSLDLSERELGDPYFSDSDYQSYPLNKKNFHQINSANSNRKIAFVDGGNQEILPSPIYSVQLNRIYFSIFKNNKRFLLQSGIPQRIDFLSYTSSKLEDKNIFFETKIRPVKDKFNEFLPDERDLYTKAREENVDAGTQAGMDRMASMARRFAEWKIAEKVIDLELESGDIILRDGSLQTGHQNEYKYVEKAFRKAMEKDVIFTGLSKTCRLTTDTQVSLIDSIQRLVEDSNIKYDKWCYYPVARSKEKNREHNAVIMVVKLNKHAHTAFRFEIFKEQADTMSEKEIFEIVSCIADYSRDIKVPGYPYGLIEADLWARVKNEEMEGYKTKLYSELSRMGLWSRTNPLIKIINTHEKLDGQ